jgi:peptidoglycan/LPS O-acetylase OafA/YrhL
LWLALLLTSVTVALLGYKIFSLAGASWLVAQCVGLIYTPGFLRSFGFGSYNGALWTIPVELQFYLVLPVLCYVLSGFRSHTAALLGAFLVFVLLAVLSREYAPSLVLWDLENEPLEQKLLRYSFIPNFFLFLSGALAYRLSLWAHPAIYGKALFWFCAVALFAQFVSINSVTQIIWYLLLAGFTLSAAYTCVGAQKFLHGQDISYGVYIYHGLILNLLVEFGCKSNPLFVGVVLINSYVVAFLSWHLVERPCLKFKFKPGWPRLIVRDNRPMAPIA